MRASVLLLRHDLGPPVKWVPKSQILRQFRWKTQCETCNVDNPVFEHLKVRYRRHFVSKGNQNWSLKPFEALVARPVV